MQKLTLLGLFLSCFEIQNVLGLWEGMELDLPQPDLTKCAHLGTAEGWRENLSQTKIFVKDKMLVIFFYSKLRLYLGECWVGNKCQFDVQCGENGNCKNRQKIGNDFWPTGYVKCTLTKIKSTFLILLWTENEM